MNGVWYILEEFLKKSQPSRSSGTPVVHISQRKPKTDNNATGSALYQHQNKHKNIYTPDSPARISVAKHHIRNTLTNVNNMRKGRIVTPTIIIFTYWYHGRCIVRLMNGLTWSIRWSVGRSIGRWTGGRVRGWHDRGIGHHNGHDREPGGGWRKRAYIELYCSNGKHNIPTDKTTSKNRCNKDPDRCTPYQNSYKIQRDP